MQSQQAGAGPCLTLVPRVVPDLQMSFALVGTTRDIHGGSTKSKIPRVGLPPSLFQLPEHVEHIPISTQFQVLKRMNRHPGTRAPRHCHATDVPTKAAATGGAICGIDGVAAAGAGAGMAAATAAATASAAFTATLFSCQGSGLQHINKYDTTYIHICVCDFSYKYLYLFYPNFSPSIYIYIHREREGERERVCVRTCIFR